MKSRKRILVIDYDKKTADDIRHTMSQDDFSIENLYSAEDVLKYLGNSIPDLIIADLNIPEIDGVDLCQTLADDYRTKNVPLIVVSKRSTEADIVTALKYFANDYVVKPYSLNVLTARIEALLRTVENSRQQPGAGIFEVENLKLNTFKREVLLSGERLELTKSEFDLLAIMMAKKGKIFSRETIINTIRDSDKDVCFRAVDNIVNALRKKLKEASHMIETVRGIGYRVNEDA